MIFNHKERKEIYGEMGKPPSTLRVAIMFIIATGIIAVLPFCAGRESGEKQAAVLKENRVYISKETYDDFVKSNP